MANFTSIESFRHIVKYVKKDAQKFGGLPVINYTGTVKLHGSFASVRYLPGATRIFAQSKSTVLSIENDNYGFARYVEDNIPAFIEIYNQYFKEDDSVTLLGEWVGKGVQRKVAVSELERHFVLFAVLLNGEYVPLNPNIYNHDAKIYNIKEVPTYSIDIDFANAEDSVAKLEEITLAIEKECPWGIYRGVTGIGEGCVWTVADPKYFSNTDLWFKTKGMEHKNDNTIHKIDVSPKISKNVLDCVDNILPTWRLEQGLSHLRENKIDLIPQNIPQYLKWIAQDILKEESDVIEASGLDWKKLTKEVTNRARIFYITETSKEF